MERFFTSNDIVKNLKRVENIIYSMIIRHIGRKNQRKVFKIYFSLVFLENLGIAMEIIVIGG